MFIDALLKVCAAQVFAATGLSVGSIDLGVTQGKGTPPFRQIGTGEDLVMAVAVKSAAFITSTDESYLFEVVSTTDGALSAGLVVIASRNFTAAQAAAGALALGTLFNIPIPDGLPTQEFLGLRVTVAGTTPTITIDAWLTSNNLFSILAQSYAKNFTA